MSALINGPMCVFDCPRGVGMGRGKCTAQMKGPDAPWKNSGTDEKPTLSPSYNCVWGVELINHNVNVMEVTPARAKVWADLLANPFEEGRRR